MADLSVTYMGLPLRNPLIVSSSSLTHSTDGARRAEAAGAGAVVLKSLFEEQIKSEIDDESETVADFLHPEAVEYVQQMGMRLGPSEYLKLVEETKKALSIPVIASVNCVSAKWWASFARQLQEAGADAIELNIAIMPTELTLSSEGVERTYSRIVDRVRREVGIPLAVKLGPYFTALPGLSVELRKQGAAALVLFNRFYQLDIDIEKVELSSGYQFSAPEELHLPLRWISILYDRVGCELAASTGVHDAAGMVKLLLAGAQAVQVCSTLYKNGYDQVGSIIEGLSTWMDSHGYARVDDFRGILSRSRSTRPEYFERLQYIRALTGIS